MRLAAEGPLQRPTFRPNWAPLGPVSTIERLHGCPPPFSKSLTCLICENKMREKGRKTTAYFLAQEHRRQEHHCAPRICLRRALGVVGNPQTHAGEADRLQSPLSKATNTEPAQANNIAALSKIDAWVLALSREDCLHRQGCRPRHCSRLPEKWAVHSCWLCRVCLSKPLCFLRHSTQSEICGGEHRPCHHFTRSRVGRGTLALQLLVPVVADVPT